jgi:hypothetical protein
MEFDLNWNHGDLINIKIIIEVPLLNNDGLSSEHSETIFKDPL